MDRERNAGYDRLADLLVERLIEPLADAVAQRLAIEKADPSPEKLLTTNQLANRLDVNTETVYRWVRSSPTFPVVNINVGAPAGHPVYRFKLQDVERWLRERSVGRSEKASTST